jgi:hypothetical protein
MLDAIVISLRDPGPTAGRDMIFTRTERGKAMKFKTGEKRKMIKKEKLS